MVQQNQDPFSPLTVNLSLFRFHMIESYSTLNWWGYITAYVDQMGKKIDKVDELQDWT